MAPNKHCLGGKNCPLKIDQPNIFAIIYRKSIPRSKGQFKSRSQLLVQKGEKIIHKKLSITLENPWKRP